MLDTLLLLTGLVALVLPWIVTLANYPTWTATAWLALGAIVGLLGMPILGTFWLNLLSPDTMTSQGGGIAYLVVFLPLFALLGLLTGLWAIALSCALWPRSTTLTQPLIVSLLVSLLVGSTLLWLMLLVIAFLFQAMEQDNVRFVGVVAMTSSILSAWLGQRLTRWLGSRFW